VIQIKSSNNKECRELLGRYKHNNIAITVVVSLFCVCYLLYIIITTHTQRNHRIPEIWYHLTNKRNVQFIRSCCLSVEFWCRSMCSQRTETSRLCNFRRISSNIYCDRWTNFLLQYAHNPSTDIPQEIEKQERGLLTMKTTNLVNDNMKNIRLLQNNYSKNFTILYMM